MTSMNNTVGLWSASNIDDDQTNLGSHRRLESKGDGFVVLKPKYHDVSE